MQDALFQLISTLNHGQKRMVTKSLGERDNDYFTLFNLLNKQTVYDEEIILKKYKKSKRLLSHDKNYLFERILKILRPYYQEESIYCQIHATLEDVYILYDNGLYDSCLKRIRKVEKLCIEYEQFAVIEEALLLKRKIIKHAGEVNLNILLDEIATDIQNYRNLKEIENRFIRIYDHLYLIIKNEFSLVGKESKAYAKILMDNTILKDFDKALTFRSKNSFYACYFIYNKIIGEKKIAKMFSKKILDLWEEHEQMQRLDEDHYRAAQYNFVINSFFLHEFDEFEWAIKKMKTTPARSLRLKAHEFNNIIYLELIYYLNNGQVDKAFDLMPDLKSGLKKYSNVISRDKLNSLSMLGSTVCFLNEDYEEALPWLEEILSHKMDYRQDVQLFARMFKVITLYEYSCKGGRINYNALLAELETAYRYIRAKNKVRILDKIIYQFLSKLFNLVDKDEKAKVYKETAKILKEIPEEIKEKMIGHNEIEAWIKSKAENRPMIEVYTELGKL